jgi:ABC-type iron transport system FetAB permease component
MDWITLLVFVASVPLAGQLAHERNRPSRRWLWIAVVVGPLAPLALLVLGDRPPAPAR